MTGELLWSGTPEGTMGRVVELRRAAGGRLALILRASGRTTIPLSPGQMRALATAMLEATQAPPEAPPGGPGGPG